MTAFGCKTEEEDKTQPQGKLTVTGLASYNGKFILAMSDGSSVQLMGAASVNMSSQELKAASVSDGKAVLPVYIMASGKLSPYTGNDQNVQIGLNISTTESIEWGKTDFAASLDVTANFTSGNATVAWQ
jgi:hypothetical protein